MASGCVKNAMSKLDQKLKALPTSPGVYLYKNAGGKIIYVGKAAILKNRVRQYFQNGRPKDTKTALLVADIADLDWLEVGSEIEALFLESELIKRYKPKYNVDLKDDKHYQYVRIDLKSQHPTVRITRRPYDDGATYVGPFVEGIRPALKLLRRIFPYDTTPPSTKRSQLLADIGLSPGLELGKTTLTDYRANLHRLLRYLRDKPGELERQLTREMKGGAKSQDFELAAKRRNQLSALRRLSSQIIFGDQELFDITKDQALDGLAKLLQLSGLPRRIEGYDISHISGTHNVASMVVFIDGVSNKQDYRKFRMRTPGNDDFAHMREVITRRFSGSNVRDWPKPELLLIDGGKGQLSAALGALRELGLSLPAIGLAKRYEEIIVPVAEGFEVLALPHDSPVVKLLMRVRDESHRFAVSYHTTLKVKSQTHSPLDDIPGIGPVTRRRLLRHFGSLKRLIATPEAEIATVVGPKKARLLKRHLGGSR